MFNKTRVAGDIHDGGPARAIDGQVGRVGVGIAEDLSKKIENVAN